MKRTLLIVSVVIAVAFLAYSQSPRKAPSRESPFTVPPKGKSRAYVLQPDEGEVLARNGGIIKVSPQSGSQRLALVVSPLPKGRRISVHMHEHEDEVFFAHKGRGVAVLNDERTPIEEGSVIYIPQGTWHSIESSEDMQLVWLTSPPLYVELHRMLFNPGGLEPPKEEGDRLMRKYGFRVKTP